MSWISKFITADDAQARALEVWEVELKYWGCNSTIIIDDEGNNGIFPATGSPGLPAAAAIAIGPRSTVDRCWVFYNLQKNQVDGVGTGLPIFSTPQWDYLRRCSVGSPLTYPQPANQSSVGGANLTNNGSVSIVPSQSGASSVQPYGTGIGFFDTTIFGNAYLKTNGSSANIDDTVGGFVPPVLHLNYYLRTPSVAIPTKRFPLTMSFSGSTSADDAEVKIASVPVYGRRTIILRIRYGGPAGSTGDARVGLIGWGQPGPAQVIVPQETTAYTQLGLLPAGGGGAGPSSRAIISPAYGDYLLLYGTAHTTGGANGAFTYDVYAIDD